MKLYLLVTTILLSLLLPSIGSSVDCPGKEPREIEAKDYWFYLYQGTFQETTEDETFIYGVASFHCDAKVKVRKVALNNRQDKEDAYLHIVKTSIFSMNDPNDKSPIDISVASKLTDQEFETQLEWLEWWGKNRKRLELSEDGSILVVRRCKKTEGLDRLIAKVGTRNIIYDEIMDDGCDEYSQNREISALNRIIEAEVIKQEIDAMDFKPSDSEIDEKAKEMIQRNFEIIGENEAEREEVFEKQRKIALTTRKALSIWQEDNKKGDEFAEKELLPLVGHTIYWDQVKKFSNNEETIKALNAWEQFTEVPASEYINVYVELGGDGLKQSAVNELKDEKLKAKVIPNYLESNEADREYEFKVWLRKRMAEKTVIYDDNYKLALEID